MRAVLVRMASCAILLNSWGSPIAKASQEPVKSYTCTLPALESGTPIVRSTDLLRSAGEYRLESMRLFVQVNFSPDDLPWQDPGFTQEMWTQLREALAPGSAGASVQVPELPAVPEIPPGTLNLPENAGRFECLQRSLEAEDSPETLSETEPRRQFLERYKGMQLQMAAGLPVVVDARNLMTRVTMRLGISATEAGQETRGVIRHNPTRAFGAFSEFEKRAQASALGQDPSGDRESFRFVLERLDENRIRLALRIEREKHEAQTVNLAEQTPDGLLQSSIPVYGRSELNMFVEGIFRYVP